MEEPMEPEKCPYCRKVDCPDPDRHADWMDILASESEEEE